MAKQHLTDLYPLHSRVEIMLSKQGWQTGLVVRHQYPGVWVLDGAGNAWFVTNRQNIRPYSSPDQDET